MTTITNAIYTKHYNMYQSPNFTDDSLKYIRSTLETQNELALDNYCRFDQEEEEELANTAWEIVGTIRMYNHEVIKAIDTILEERAKEVK